MDRRPNDGTDATTILRCAAVDLTGILCTTHLLIPDFQRSAAVSRPSLMTLQNFSTGSARRQTCSVQGLGCVQLVVQGSCTTNVGSMSRKYELIGGIFCKTHQLGLTVSITIQWLQLSTCTDDRSPCISKPAFFGYRCHRFACLCTNLYRLGRLTNLHTNLCMPMYKSAQPRQTPQLLYNP